MADLFILHGTLNTGETAPVLIDSTGRVRGIGVQGEKGEQGEQGEPAPVYAIRIDASMVHTIYTGRAAVGTAESSTGWTIKRRTFSTVGVLLTTTTVTGAWSNRASLTYS